MKIIAYIGKEIKIIMKIKSFNAKKPKKMLTKAVNGTYGGEIFISIGRSYDFIEASCSSLYHPDYKYKRFPCNYDGYLSAHAVESGRERTTLTDSRIKLVLSDRLFKSHFVRWG